LNLELVVDHILSTSEVDLEDARLFKASSGAVKSIEAIPANDAAPASLSVSGYASTRVLDNSKDIVVPSGIDLSIWRNNPIALWDHDLSEPIGIGEEMNIDDYGLFVNLRLSRVTKRSRAVSDLVQDGILRMFSIGYVPTRIIKRGAKGFDQREAQLMRGWPEYTGGAKRIIEACTIIEVSIVPQADNPACTFTDVQWKCLATLGLSRPRLSIVHQAERKPPRLRLA